VDIAPPVLRVMVVAPPDGESGTVRAGRLIEYLLRGGVVEVAVEVPGDGCPFEEAQP
jgi:hypothetical protein